MLSVLMATHNGADTIDRTLSAMSALDAPAGGWKLVVVNNASTDDSEQHILKWRDRLPLDYIVEPRLGKSKAINTAFSRAEGDFIVMTDDDILPDKDWLTEWRRMADAYPGIAAMGGAVVPEFDGARPAWLVDDGCFGYLYGRTPPIPEGEMKNEPPFNVAGANLAVRKSIIDQGWRFGEDFMVGPTGLMGEDSDFVTRLSKSGHKIGFAPTARVRHIIHKNQVSLAWIQRRSFRHGRYMFISEDTRWDEASKRYDFRFPFWRVHECLKLMPSIAGALLRRDMADAFLRWRFLFYYIGTVSQALSLAWQDKSFHLRRKRA